MTKKIRKIQIFRHLTQLVLFFLLPGLYMLAFSEFKKVYQMIIKGNFNFIQAFPSLIEFSTVIILTILLGRFFCGWFCAFGAFNDWIYLVSKNVFKINFKVNKKVDSVLKYIKYIILLLILIIVCTMGSNILQNTSPWDAFAQITDFPQVLFNLTIGCILLFLIAIGAIFIERFFCRYLCPLGAVFTIFSKISIFKINKPTSECGKCSICTNNCSMGLPLNKVKYVRGGDCINCLKCVEVCPRNNAQSNILGQNVDSKLAGSLAIAAFTGVYCLNNFGGTVLTQKGLTSVASTVLSSKNNPSQKYKDGTYVGTGTGFRGGTTKVQVTISNDKITNINTVSSDDTPDFYYRAIGAVSNEIISSQSASVDTVSGATYSSQGIIGAVQDALNQALVSSSSNISSTNNNSNTKIAANAVLSNKTQDNTSTLSVSENTAQPTASTTTKISNSSSNKKSTMTKKKVAISNTTSTTNTNANNTNTSTNTASATQQQSKYKDGTYTGTGTGFRGGATTISVTVKGDKITNIETISTDDTPDFYNRAAGDISNEIITSQSTSVDTVSGATFSSRGIIDAVANALSQAEN